MDTAPMESVLKAELADGEIAFDDPSLARQGAVARLHARAGGDPSAATAVASKATNPAPASCLRALRAAAGRSLISQ